MYYLTNLEQIAMSQCINEKKEIICSFTDNINSMS